MLRSIDNFDLSAHNTFRMNVRCARYIEYDCTADLFELDFGQLPQPVMHIGGGSNLLFTKDWFPGTVLHSAIKTFSIESESDEAMLLEVGAGITLDDLCAWACDSELWGIENLSGIPGEVGAAAVQNVGAYGTEIKDAVTRVKCFDRQTREIVVLSTKDCEYGYRDSLFKHEGAKGRYIVIAVLLQLSKLYRPNLSYSGLRSAFAPGEELTPVQVRAAVLSQREHKLPDPSVIGSAGSFFKNPVMPRTLYEHIVEIEGSQVPHYDLPDDMVKVPAAWMIDRCGFKGREMGGAAVHQSQPLVLINKSGSASAEDILALESTIIEGVRARYGVVLSPEVEHI